MSAQKKGRSKKLRPKYHQREDGGKMNKNTLIETAQLRNLY